MVISNSALHAACRALAGTCNYDVVIYFAHTLAAEIATVSCRGISGTLLCLTILLPYYFVCLHHHMPDNPVDGMVVAHPGTSHTPLWCDIDVKRARAGLYTFCVVCGVVADFTEQADMHFFCNIIAATRPEQVVMSSKLNLQIFDKVLKVLTPLGIKVVKVHTLCRTHAATQRRSSEFLSGS